MRLNGKSFAAICSIPQEKRERRGVGQIALGSRVKVNLRGAFATRRECGAENLQRHAARLPQADHAVGEVDARLLQRRDCRGTELLKYPRHERGWTGLTDEADEAETELVGDRERELEDEGMQMQVRMTVPIGRWKTESAKLFELPPDLCTQRFSQARV